MDRSLSMTPVRRHVSLLCLLAGWICANGVVWNVVQVIGWARMYQDFSQVYSTGEALRRTFDGSGPCHFCRVSQAAEDTAERELPRDVLGAGAEKILLIVDWAPDLVLSAPALAWPATDGQFGQVRPHEIDIPPPRV